MRLLDRFCELLANALAVLAGVFLTLMCLLACANMVSRAVWLPIEGTFELMGFFGAMATALSLGFAQRHRSHIAVAMLVQRFPRPLRRALDALAALVSAAFFGLCGYETGKWAMFLVNTGEVSENLRIPYHPFVFAAAAGCMAMAFLLVVDAAKALTDNTQTA